MLGATSLAAALVLVLSSSESLELELELELELLELELELELLELGFPGMCTSSVSSTVSADATNAMAATWSATSSELLSVSGLLLLFSEHSEGSELLACARLRARCALPGFAFLLPRL